MKSKVTSDLQSKTSERCFALSFVWNSWNQLRNGVSGRGGRDMSQVSCASSWQWMIKMALVVMATSHFAKERVTMNGRLGAIHETADCWLLTALRFPSPQWLLLTDWQSVRPNSPFVASPRAVFHNVFVRDTHWFVKDTWRHTTSRRLTNRKQEAITGQKYVTYIQTLAV